MRKTALFLAILMATLSANSCGADEGVSETTSSQNESTTSEAAPEYTFTKEFDGTEIRVLNSGDVASMHVRVDTGESNGETLNDAQYNAVRRCEEEMGIKWSETNVHILKELPELVRSLIMSGEDAYDIIYQSCSQNYATFADEGFYYNLLDFKEARLDEKWWLENYNSLMTMNDSLYAGLGYSHLACIDGISMLFFNQDMMNDLGLELPYDLVRSGSWTIDRLAEYCKSAASLNGDEAFSWTDDGSCVWGISAQNDSGGNWLHYLDEGIVENQNGKAILNAGTTDRFYEACEKVSKILSSTDGSVYLGHFNGDDLAGSYINCFEAERALFGCSEVAKANRMRNLDFMFGALPYPKLDENQERFYAGLAFIASGAAIPVTCKTPERSASVADAMNYIYCKDVWPVFSDVTLKAKNLRNEDSIEMLGIILGSAAPNLATVYSIGGDYLTALSENLRSGSSSVASLIASYKDAMESEIKKINK